MPRAARKPKLAVWKFASCDGCQLSLLELEDELLELADAVTIAYFPEATRAVVRGPYDISLVEGSITTPHDEERIRQIRRRSKLLIAIGSCATAGGGGPAVFLPQAPHPDRVPRHLLARSSSAGSRRPPKRTAYRLGWPKPS